MSIGFYGTCELKLIISTCGRQKECFGCKYFKPELTNIRDAKYVLERMLNPEYENSIYTWHQIKTALDKYLITRYWENQNE